MTARDARTGTDQARLDSGWGQEAARLLALLRQDRVAGVSVATMRERGIEAPAQAIYTLQLSGYAIDRVLTAVNGRKSPVYRLSGGPHYRKGAPHDEP